jgi:hypothetical protein
MIKFKTILARRISEAVPEMDETKELEICTILHLKQTESWPGI